MKNFVTSSDWIIFSKATLCYSLDVWTLRIFYSSPSISSGRGSGNATPSGGVSPGGSFLSPSSGAGLILPTPLDSLGGSSTGISAIRPQKNLTKSFEAVTAATAAAASAGDENMGAAQTAVNKHHNLFLQLSQQNNHAFQASAHSSAPALLPPCV